MNEQDLRVEIRAHQPLCKVIRTRLNESFCFGMHTILQLFYKALLCLIYSSKLVCLVVPKKQYLGQIFVPLCFWLERKLIWICHFEKKKTWMNGSYNSTETDGKPKLYIKEKPGNVWSHRACTRSKASNIWSCTLSLAGLEFKADRPESRSDVCRVFEPEIWHSTHE